MKRARRDRVFVWGQVPGLLSSHLHRAHFGVQVPQVVQARQGNCHRMLLSSCLSSHASAALAYLSLHTISGWGRDPHSTTEQRDTAQHARSQCHGLLASTHHGPSRQPRRAAWRLQQTRLGRPARRRAPPATPQRALCRGLQTKTPCPEPPAQHASTLQGRAVERSLQLPRRASLCTARPFLLAPGVCFHGGECTREQARNTPAVDTGRNVTFSRTPHAGGVWTQVQQKSTQVQQSNTPSFWTV